MTYRPFFATIATMLTAVTPLTTSAQGVPAKGTLLCEVQYQHMMPVGGNSKNTIMDSGGLCTLEKGGPAGAKITYVVGLEFNDKGIGTLLYGGGNATVDGKV
ncbi:MAG: hypothetical protein WBD51_12770, partial [Burkholderiaceae bacterium]